MRRFSLTWRWPMYSSMRFGRSVRSSWRSSSLGRLSFTRADIDSGAMVFSNSNASELAQGTPQHRVNRKFAAIAERCVDSFLRRRSLIAQIEQRRERIRSHVVFRSTTPGFGGSTGFFRWRHRQSGHLFPEIDYQPFRSLSADTRDQRESREVVGLN